MPRRHLSRAAPPPPSGPWVECLWERRAPPDARHDARRILPDGCIDLIWSDGAGLLGRGPEHDGLPRADGSPARAPWACGSGPAARRRSSACPADALRDLRAPGGRGLGSGTRTASRMPWRRSRPGGARWAAAGLAGPAPGAGVVADPAGDRGRARLSLDRAEPVAGLADRLGVGQRHLRRRFAAEVGYGPKRFARVVRLQRALAIAGARPAGGWSEVAYEAGYADQSHLVERLPRPGRGAAHACSRRSRFLQDGRPPERDDGRRSTSEEAEIERARTWDG